MIVNKILTIEDVKLLNSQNDAHIMLDSTRGQDASIIAKLNKNVKIQVLGGYKDDAYKNTKYRKRTFYTPQQVASIINLYSQFEKGIDEKWTDLEKAYFVYTSMVLYMEYDYQSSIIRDFEESQILSPFLYGKNVSEAKLNFGKKLFNECKKNENIPSTYRNLCTLLTKKSHCAGFANCLKEGLDRIGIKNGIIHINNLHTLNTIIIDDKFLIADPTFERSHFDDCNNDIKNETTLVQYFGTSNSYYDYFDKHLHIVLDTHDIEPDDTNNFLKLSKEKSLQLKNKILPQVLDTINHIEHPKYEFDKPIKIKENATPSL